MKHGRISDPLPPGGEASSSNPTRIKFFYDLIRFRNSDSVGVVIIQCFMLLSACLIIAGLIYVTIVMVVIIFHHLMWDRDPRVVPPYVKQALQFDSSEGEEEEECRPGGGGTEGSGGGGATAEGTDNNSIIEIDEESPSSMYSSSSSAARKIHNLEMFMKVGSKEPGDHP